MALFLVSAPCNGYMCRNFGEAYWFHLQGDSCFKWMLKWYTGMKWVHYIVWLVGVWQITAMEGGKRGSDCPKPMELRFQKSALFFMASLVGDTESNVQW